MRKLKNVVITTLLITVLSLMVSFKSDFFEIAKQIEIYTAVFKELNMHYIDEINPAQLTSDAINTSLKNLDPYTKYYDEQGIEDATINRRGSYGGIGVSSSTYDKEVFIREVYQNSPAHKSGLKAGDQIIKIDDIWVNEIEKEAISSLMRGMPGTKVSLKIKRNQETLTVDVTRNSVEVDPVPFYKMIDDQVGYIAFTTFNAKASKRIKESYEDLKQEGMTKLIIDVRGNPGGLLSEVIKIVNYFVPKNKVVVTTKSKVKKWSETYKTKQKPIDVEIPIVVLINGASASASEILSGALQDMDRAVVMGERSFGKGLVQRFRKLPYGTQMKLTISKYYTPSGRCIQELDYTNRDLKTGIVPKFKQENKNVFKTSNGRKVYDGGGVTPDITLEKPEKTTATKALFKSNAIFKFATDYQYKNKITNEEDFMLSDVDFSNFIEFLNVQKTTFKTKAEISFEASLQKAKEEAYAKDIQNGYDQLITDLNKKKISELYTNKLEILEYISDEILKQNYFKSGMYRYKFKHDKVIQRATIVLNNEKDYNKLLK